VDGAVAAWTRSHTAEEVIAAMRTADVPAGSIYSVADMFADPQYLARGLFETVETPTGPLKIPAILPKLNDTPGRTDWAGPALGAHNREILGGRLGLSDEDLADLAARGVI
jgi:crotonobetainyl-CoA:carnitine CoA-transferase CaiB-like acyl-CoA transferase